jgi:hypothetical protein
VLYSTLAKVKAELELTSTDAVRDALISEQLRQASAAIDTYCNRIFGRQTYSEALGGYGGTFLTLYHAPIITLGTITFDGDILTDVTIAEPLQGTILREAGFDWTTIRYAGLSAAGGWMADGIPLPLEEQPDYTVAYTAGFILPIQNLLNVATVSASNADGSFNDSASGFPALLKSGDIIETSGFTNAANNGRYAVTGTPTTAKIVVTATLITEAAAAGRTVLVQSLPNDVEKAAIETTKSYFAQRAVDSRVVERHAGPIGVRVSEAATASLGIPPLAAGLLRPWVRRR